MGVIFYEYTTCSTCQKGARFLAENKIAFERRAIVETPPTLAELKKMLGFLRNAGGDFKNLFNTSGVVYRELKIAEKLKAGLSAEEALELLAKNGKLIKRPFVLTAKGGLVGFKEEQWKALFEL